jgi:DNA repair protein RadC
MAITDWPVGERPREKLLTRGAASLSDAELLAIFLRTGVAGKSAVDMARELLTQFGSLTQLFAASEADFCAVHGMGQAKYVQLQAIMEMSLRGLTLQTEHSVSTPLDGMVMSSFYHLKVMEKVLSVSFCRQLMPARFHPTQSAAHYQTGKQILVPNASIIRGSFLRYVLH